MRQAGLVPAPLAQLPWRVILLVMAIGGFGLVVLYSAAGGSVRPWALSQGIKLVVFLGAAIVASRPSSLSRAVTPTTRSDSRTNPIAWVDERTTAPNRAAVRTTVSVCRASSA